MNNFKYIFLITFFICSCAPTPEFKQRGFESEEQFLRATEAGFIERETYELALSKGFENNEEFILAGKYNLKTKPELNKFLIDNLCTETKSFGNICLNIPYEMSHEYPSIRDDDDISWTSYSHGQTEKIFKTSAGTYYDDATDVLKEYALAMIKKNIENADFDLSLICTAYPGGTIYKLDSILIFRSDNLITPKHYSALSHSNPPNRDYYRDKYLKNGYLNETRRWASDGTANRGGFVLVIGDEHVDDLFTEETIIRIRNEKLFAGSLDENHDEVNSFYNFSSGTKRDDFFQLEINRKTAKAKVVDVDLNADTWIWGGTRQAVRELKRPQTCKEYPVEKLRNKIKPFIIDLAESAYDKSHRYVVSKKEAEEKRKAELKKLKETENKI